MKPTKRSLLGLMVRDGARAPLTMRVELGYLNIIVMFDRRTGVPHPEERSLDRVSKDEATA
jgi:hypothetical protein